MKEIWKDIEGFNGKYQISNFGNVRSFSRWKNGDLLKLGMGGTGYYYVNLVKSSRKDVHIFYIHRLVAKYFIPNPNLLPEVNHKDGNKLNNRADNLEWVTRCENIQHAYNNGLISKRIGKQNPNSKVVIQKNKDGEIIRTWDSVADIVRELGYSSNSIICCCNKKPKYHTAYGFIWEYQK